MRMTWQNQEREQPLASTCSQVRTRFSGGSEEAGGATGGARRRAAATERMNPCSRPSMLTVSLGGWKSVSTVSITSRGCAASMATEAGPRPQRAAKLSTGDLIATGGATLAIATARGGARAGGEATATPLLAARCATPRAKPLSRAAKFIVVVSGVKSVRTFVSTCGSKVRRNCTVLESSPQVCAKCSTGSCTTGGAVTTGLSMTR
mmetsp:Transcript_27462/g.53667  ORF Transcript_27462/g.53667 Transcript_27462/m.53667 type:complete len:206 (-) Transcript_27462:1193-1810(-)